MDDDTPMERQLKVATDIARLQQTVEDMGQRLDDGFERTGSALERLGAVLDRHDRQLERIAAREARWKGAGKWLAGVVASVVVAALVMVLGLRR